MSYLHFRIACYIIFYILIWVENICIDLSDDAMQGFSSSLWGFRGLWPSVRCISRETESHPVSARMWTGCLMPVACWEKSINLESKGSLTDGFFIYERSIKYLLFLPQSCTVRIQIDNANASQKLYTVLKAGPGIIPIFWWCLLTKTSMIYVSVFKKRMRPIKIWPIHLKDPFVSNLPFAYSGARRETARFP